MDTINVQKAAARLREEKRKLSEVIAQIEESGLNNWLTDSTGELSAYDNHPADLGSETFERSKDLALRDNETVLLSQIEHALDKIQNGSYGMCDVCGSSIGNERLEALPWATACVHCQEKLDSHEIATRPVEEYSLQPPFGRSFDDNDPQTPVGFDGEDSLQAVWRYGSSDSPQDLPGSHGFANLNMDPDEQLGVVDPVDVIPARFDGSHDKTTRIRWINKGKRNQ